MTIPASSHSPQLEESREEEEHVVVVEMHAAQDDTTTSYSSSINNSNNVAWSDEYFANENDIIAVFDHDTARLQEQEEKQALAHTGSNIGLFGFVIGLFVGFVFAAIIPEGEPSFGVEIGTYLVSFFVIPMTLAFFFRRVAQWRSQRSLMHQRNEDQFTKYHTALTTTGIRHVVKPGSKSPVSGENYELLILCSNIISTEIENVNSLPTVQIKAVDPYVRYYHDSSVAAESSSGNTKDRGLLFAIPGLQNHFDFQTQVMALKQQNSPSSNTSDLAVDVRSTTIISEDESNLSSAGHDGIV